MGVKAMHHRFHSTPGLEVQQQRQMVTCRSQKFRHCARCSGASIPRAQAPRSTSLDQQSAVLSRFRPYTDQQKPSPLDSRRKFLHQGPREPLQKPHPQHVRHLVERPTCWRAATRLSAPSTLACRISQAATRCPLAHLLFASFRVHLRLTRRDYCTGHRRSNQPGHTGSRGTPGR